MKKIIFLLLFSYAMGFAQQTDALFLDANNLYKEGAYSKAIDLYKSIEAKGVASDDLYFNLGNSYYKLNKIAPAIYNFEKALLINPLHSDAQNNLTFAKRMTIDNIKVLPTTFLQSFNRAVIMKFSYNTWAYIAVLMAFLAAIWFLWYHFAIATRRKLLLFNLTILSVIVLAVSVFFAFHNYGVIKKNRVAIVFAAKTEVKNAPTLSSDELFNLHEGTKVVVLDAVDDWKKIKIADGKTGWIIASDIRELK
ncbi:MAG: hypothetical protein COB60_10195 [Flavobacteriaceae bacterium]|nr:MAG: hypothetical protein COB60_10195 [Flavobacteriaceae bacterium]